MGFVKEFREFAVRGSVVDLAVGIIIGAAFGKIVTSLVNDIIMPPVSILLGGADFSNRYWVLRGDVPAGSTLEEAKALGATTVNYGTFANTVIEFAIIAFAVFLLIKQVNRLKRRSEGTPPAATRPCPECTTAIALAAKRCPHCTAKLA